MQYMDATLIFNKREVRPDGILLEMVIWRLPNASEDRPHGFKYRLYAGRGGKTLVRYDNETGKGDHKHVGTEESEVPYRFVSLSELISDFIDDVERLK